MNRTQLKNKLDKLEELKDIKHFISFDDDYYKIKIIRKSYSFIWNEWEIFSKKITISEDILKEIIDNLITYCENDIDKVLGSSDEIESW